jgi:hypothetical protein
MRLKGHSGKHDDLQPTGKQRGEDSKLQDKPLVRTSEWPYAAALCNELLNNGPPHYTCQRPKGHKGEHSNYSCVDKNLKESPIPFDKLTDKERKSLGHARPESSASAIEKQFMKIGTELAQQVMGSVNLVDELTGKSASERVEELLASSLVPSDEHMPKFVLGFLRKGDHKYNELVKLIWTRIQKKEEFTQIAVRLRQVMSQQFTEGWRQGKNEEAAEKTHGS